MIVRVLSWCVVMVVIVVLGWMAVFSAIEREVSSRYENQTDPLRRSLFLLP
jgi:hypothetical protein